MTKTTATTVEEYIHTFPEEIQKILKEIRLTLKKAAPEAGEAIKYNMPTLTFHGNILSYGVFAKHLGIYPAPAGDEAFNRKLEPYRSGKATIQFPLNEPMPLDLIAQVVKIRVTETLKKASRKN